MSLHSRDEITKIHHLSGYRGVRRTCYFVQLTNPSVSTRDVVKRCQTCQSIDPASVKWRKGKLGVGSTWSRLTMDMTHYGSQHFLTLIDCGPSRFTVWWPLLTPRLYKYHPPTRLSVLRMRAARGDTHR